MERLYRNPPKIKEWLYKTCWRGLYIILLRSLLKILCVISLKMFFRFAHKKDHIAYGSWPRANYNLLQLITKVLLHCRNLCLLQLQQHKLLQLITTYYTQLQTNYKPITHQLHTNYRPISDQFQTNFRPISNQLQQHKLLQIITTNYNLL